MTKPLTEIVAAEVRAELARQNITRSDAAAHLGISRNLFWQRLRGESPFTVDELEALAALLDIPVTRLMLAPTAVSP